MATIIDRWRKIPFKLTGGKYYRWATPLHVAARCGNAGAIRSLLDAGMICAECKHSCRHSEKIVPVNHIEENLYGKGLPALHFAIIAGHVAVVKMLLAIDAVDLGGTGDYPPALVFAAGAPSESCNGDIIRLLMARADVNGASPYDYMGSWMPDWGPYLQGHTPLMAAARKKSMTAVKVLLASTQIDVNSKRPCGPDGSPKSALTIALFHNYFALSNLLAGHKNIDIDVRAAEYISPTAICALARRDGDNAVMALLLKSGLDANTVGTHRKTPLHWAAGACNSGTIAMLLESGGNVNAEDYRRRTPLHHAVRSEKVTGEILTRLVQSGADVNARSADGKTPLHYVMFNRSHRVMEAVRTLLWLGADSNARDADGMRPADAGNGLCGAGVRQFLDEARESQAETGESRQHSESAMGPESMQPAKAILGRLSSAMRKDGHLWRGRYSAHTAG